MGEIVEDMLDGDCCQWCGCYFFMSQGVPCICKDCADELTDLEKEDVVISNSDTY